ncbi:hypothetical protein PoB_002680000 [Plakobranchus ocellatus]|uniref:Uncharacterized protein n=1 Tax=Plakobranchus ocellatus TaxID=259542 RepID=A0AAV3ZWQ9_9GAST|nr:hypothetical protein PoB_002680000 [Plakobranchus ocellatus]
MFWSGTGVKLPFKAKRMMRGINAVPHCNLKLDKYNVNELIMRLHRLQAMRGRQWYVANESALGSAGTLLSRVRAPPSAPWPDGGPESLRSPCCALAIYKK